MAFQAKLYHVQPFEEGTETTTNEVPCLRESLNQLDAFVLDAGAKIYIWCGEGATPFEKNIAKMFAENKESESEVEDAVATHDMDDSFWEHLGGIGPITGQSTRAAAMPPADSSDRNVSETVANEASSVGVSAPEMVSRVTSGASSYQTGQSGGTDSCKTINSFMDANVSSPPVVKSPEEIEASTRVWAELERSQQDLAVSQSKLVNTQMDLVAANQTKKGLDEQLSDTQMLLNAERLKNKTVSGELDAERALTQDLRGEIRTLASRLCEMVLDREHLVRKVALRGDEVPPRLEWEPPALEKEEDSSPAKTGLLDLSTFLGGASPVKASSAPALAAPKPFGSWLRGGNNEQSQLATGEGSAGATLRSMWSKAFGPGRTRDEEFRDLLLSLGQVPPTRHALRGPVSNSVDRLRQMVGGSGEALGTPDTARGALWTEAVGNRLRISEKQFARVSRRRDRLRSAWTIVDSKCTADAVAVAAEEDFRNRPRTATAKTVFSESSSEDVQGIETEELYLIGAALEQIPLDVNRTLSSRDLAAFHGNGTMRAHTSEEVRDLLESFAVLKPEFGYTQGMNFLAAILLLHLDAFRGFVCFTNAVLLQPWLSACYTFNMPVVQRYFDVFEDLLMVYVPRVGKHFQQLGLTSDLFLVEWWFALFARSLPLPLVVRLWDLFFLEGDFLLYRASLAILQCFSEALLARPRDECLALLSSWPAQHLEEGRLFDTMERMGFNEKKLSASFDKVPPRPAEGETPSKT